MKRGCESDAKKFAKIDQYLLRTNEGAIVNLSNLNPLKAVEIVNLINQYLELIKSQPEQKKIISLDLSRNNLQNTNDVKNIVKALSANPISDLTTLNFSYNKIDEKCLRFIAQAFPKLNDLDLSHNMIGMIGGQDPIKLSRAFLLLPELNILNLANNDFQAAGVEAIIKVLPLSLTTLDLANNNIKKEGAKFIAHKLANNELLSLKCLRLSGNAIDDEGVKHITQALVDSGSTLEHLDLANNDMQAEGSKAIAKMLMIESSALINLILSNNKIDDEGARIIAKAILIRKKLIHLDLSGNRIGDKGALEFANQPLLDQIDHIDLGKNLFLTGKAPIHFAKILPGSQGTYVYLVDHIKEFKANNNKKAICEFKNSAAKSQMKP